MTADLDPVAKEWLFKSKDPEAELWRKRVKEIAVYEMSEARKRQALIYDHMKAEKDSYDPNAKVLRIGIVDPVIKDYFESRYGQNCFHDPEFLEDTKKKAPELFVPK